MEDLTIESISLDQTQAQVTLFNVPDQPGIAASIFEAIAAEEIMVDMIVQSTGHDELADVSFTVPRSDLAHSLEVVETLAGQLGGEITHVPTVDILTVKGIGIRSHTGVGLRMFRALSEAGINVEMINTSEVRVNVVVDSTKGRAALLALQKAFEDVLE
jgi:aspartate kinase